MTVKIRKLKRKTSTSIMLDYTDAAGKRVQRVFGRASTPEAIEKLESAAAIEAKRIELALLEGKPNPQDNTWRLDKAMKDFLTFYDATRAADATKKAYRHTAETFLNWIWSTNRARMLYGFNEHTARDFIEYRTSQGKAPGTVKGDVTRLSRIWKRLVEQGHCDSNPWRHSDVVAVTPAAGMHERAFTDNEFEKFLDEAYDSPLPYQSEFLLFFHVLGLTGLRSGEALMLRHCDIELGESPHLRIEPHDNWAPKSKRSIRQVPLCSRSADRLVGYRDKHGCDRVFPCSWTPAYVSTRFRLILSGAGLDAPDARYGQKLRVHSLRHYYATKLVTGGVDVSTIRDLLGHASIQTTNRYFNAPPEAAVAAVQSVFGRQK